MHQETYMRQAAALAEQGAGFTAPNPLVGAVIVKDERVIGAGFHEKYGQLHAERNALADCARRGENPAGAAMYVTLTPCSHYGKTPPCTEAIIESGITEVIIGSRDPHAEAADQSVEILKKAGIRVTCDFLKEECDTLNSVFFHYITHHTPYVTMKYAMTMDGKIATVSGRSRWITGKAAREQVHRDRHRNTGIMTGIGTILADDPLLTCRIENGKNPVRIICDSDLRTPIFSQVVKTAAKVPTIIATAVTDPLKHQPYQEKSCEILTVTRSPDGHLDLQDLMQQLGDRGIDSILLEGGGILNWSALKAGIVHKIQAYIAPKIFGGAGAKTPILGEGCRFPNDAVMLQNSRFRKIGEDFLIESEVTPCSQEL